MFIRTSSLTHISKVYSFLCFLPDFTTHFDLDIGVNETFYMITVTTLSMIFVASGSIRNVPVSVRRSSRIDICDRDVR